jgi:signal-transduction protein with cAMP-binding, CBS, and nucleotidyltransferase domain
MGGGTLVWVDKEDGDHHQFQKVMALRGGRIASITERDIRHTERLPAGEMRVDTLNNAMRILLASPILDGASPSTTKMLAYAGEQVSFESGETVMREGDIGTECYFVLKGAAEISLGKGRERRVIATRNPGDVIGEMALLLDTPRSATVTAQSDLEMLTLSRELFHDLLRKDHRFGIAIMQSLAQRLLETTSLDRVS